jgi:predicted ArsR family transcriptional regulator
MSTGYGNLASEALQFLERSLGPDAVLAFARTRVAELERRYLPIVEAAGPEPADRAEALARALDADGYAASVRPLGFGEIPAVQLCQCHCPVHHVARSFPELCEAETEVFARLLGVHVRRLATLAHGEHVCTTHVPDRDGAQAPPGRPSRTPVELWTQVGFRTSGVPQNRAEGPCGPSPPGSVASGTTPNSADSEETSRR